MLDNDPIKEAFTMNRFRPLSFILLGSFMVISCTRSSEEATFTISPQGGNYQAFQGTSLDVPPNAVSDKVDLTFRSLSKGEMENLGQGSFPVVAALEALPVGQTFDQPITITLTGLNLAPGVIPLVRLIDEAHDSRVLIESSLNYDPAEGTLSFEVGHFTTYAVEAGELVANTECQQTPCRCGSISIHQSDASNACSSDDCQILESEVSVQFNDCPGKPIETSYLKEISPSCTPKMELKADRETVPPVGSTAITATTSLSCVPVPDQTTDFFIEEGPGTVAPTNQMTDQVGKALTTFSATEEEGTTTVKVNATGSYYAYEVRANGESYNGPLLTYELSEDVVIKTQQTRGYFEASFNGCNEIVCIDNYQINIEFTLSENNEEGYWNSFASFNQSGSVSLAVEEMVLESSSIPSSGQILIGGGTDAEKGPITMEVISTSPNLLIKYTLGATDTDGNVVTTLRNTLVVICPGFFGDGTYKPFELPFNKDQILEGTAYLAILGRTPDIQGTYKLRLE
jgi:hypothetical protein